MYYGIDTGGHKINIENSIKDNDYCCPVCGGVLVRKFGSIKAHHFAHKTAICDQWYHDNKGEWHKNMQSHFRPEQCEIRIDGENGIFHIADVFIEGKNSNTIIEFQHSPLSQKEFDERNRFYSFHHCKYSKDGGIIPNTIIWVFDYRDKRMFIDTDIQRYGYEERMERACDNEMCLSVLSDDEKYYPATKTQHFLEISKSLYVHIHWKRATKIFNNAKSNVLIYFDVKQRRYVTGITEWHGHENEWKEFLSERANSTFDDTLAEFLVFVSYDEVQYIHLNKHLINYALLHPEYICGRSLPYSDFFDFYCNI